MTNNGYIYFPELFMKFSSLKKYLLKTYNLEMKHKMQTGGTADSSISNDPIINGTMASSMAKGGYIPKIGDTINITDINSLMKGKSGVVVMKLSEKQYIVKVLENGVSKNVIVNTSGMNNILNIDKLEKGAMLEYEDGYPTNNASSEDLESLLNMLEEKNVPYDTDSEVIYFDINKLNEEEKNHVHRLLNLKFKTGGGVGKKRTMELHDAVIYKDETYYITEKDGQLGLKTFRQGAWGFDFNFVPLSKIDVDKQVKDMYGNSVIIPTKMATGGGVDILPPQGTLLTKDKKLKLDYTKVGDNYEFTVYEGESNPVENYSRTSFKNKDKNVKKMNHNQFINYIYSEGYIDDNKMATGGGVGDFEGSGLIVVGRTQIDNNKIKEFVEDGDYYGVWNAREGYWFFQEDEDNIDELEMELTEEFAELNIDARFEYQEYEYGGKMAKGGGVDGFDKMETGGALEKNYQEAIAEKFIPKTMSYEEYVQKYGEKAKFLNAFYREKGMTEPQWKKWSTKSLEKFGVDLTGYEMKTGGFVAKSGLANAIIHYKKHPGDFSNEVQKLKDAGVTSDDVFSFSSLFNRDTFNVGYIRNGKLEEQIKKTYFNGEEQTKELKKAVALKEFILAVDNYYGEKTWYNKFEYGGSMKQGGKVKKQPSKMTDKQKAGWAKMNKVMSEFKQKKLHSGSKKGPIVKDRQQALAIALSEAREAMNVKQKGWKHKKKTGGSVSSLENYTFDELLKLSSMLVHPYRYSKNEVDNAKKIYKSVGLLDKNGNMYSPENVNLNKKTKDGKTLKDIINKFA
jgi:hypothetical protein